ncbi:MAG: hypothetical protein ACJA13_002380 [Paraglaciecola sp.]|jgi:hypothetical protein
MFVAPKAPKNKQTVVYVFALAVYRYLERKCAGYIKNKTDLHCKAHYFTHQVMLANSGFKIANRASYRLKKHLPL